MTDKEKIILKHTQLAREYMELANSDNLLSAKEWEKINARMNEILAEIQKLKDIEKTWEEFDIALVKENDLQMLTTEQVGEHLNASRQQVTMLREVGVIKAIKTGKNYMFPREEVSKFLRDYVGLDVSNKQKALKAYKVVNGLVWKDMKKAICSNRWLTKSVLTALFVYIISFTWIKINAERITSMKKKIKWNNVALVIISICFVWLYLYGQSLTRQVHELQRENRMLRMEVSKIE